MTSSKLAGISPNFFATPGSIRLVWIGFHRNEQASKDSHPFPEKERILNFSTVLQSKAETNDTTNTTASITMGRKYRPRDNRGLYLIDTGCGFSFAIPFLKK